MWRFGGIRIDRKELSFLEKIVLFEVVALFVREEYFMLHCCLWLSVYSTYYGRLIMKYECAILLE